MSLIRRRSSFRSFQPTLDATPKKSRARAPGSPRSEHLEQAGVITWAAKSRSLYMLTRELSAMDLLFAIPNAGGFSGGFKANVVRVKRLKAEGVKSGVPDLMLAYPIKNWHGLFIEMKRTDGSASKEQRDFADCLRAAGYFVVICRGCEEARTVIENYLRPLHVGVQRTAQILRDLEESEHGEQQSVR